jgi:plastocyanin
MTRLAGITSLYALMAALLLVTPLSASQDPVPETAPTEAAEQPQEPQPEPAEPPAAVPQEPAPVEPAPEPAPVVEPAPPTEPAHPEAVLPEPTAAVVEASQEPVPSKPKPRRSGDAPRASAAADTGVTIRDFEFAPGGVTVDVGDTVTWSNEGPTPHSATADDGSFDTGIFDAGQSRSHTFDQAGTFAYFCTPHPNMRGTITVRAAATGGNGSGGGGGATGAGSGTTGGDSAGTGSGTSGDSGSALPATGLDARGLLLLGLVTVALGAFLRRRAAAAE